ncbi:MAG: hypothetical protein ACOYOB_18245 [Myxococcota bacterium]
MWVRSIDLREAPGLPDGARLLDLKSGINVVVGPNASGKSTLSRAIRSTVWPSAASQSVWAVSAWVDAKGERRANLLYGRATWTPDSPALPPPEAAGAYELGIRTLLSATAADTDLGNRIAVELAGGYDLDLARKSFAASETPGNGTRRALDDANKTARTAEAATDTWVNQEQTLEKVVDALELARAAQKQLGVARHVAELVRTRAELAGRHAELSCFPAGMDRLRGDEAERLETLGSNLGRWRRQVDDLGHELDQIDAALRQSPLSAEPTAVDLEAFRKGAEAIGDTERRRDEAHAAAAEAARKAQTLRNAVWATDAPTERIEPGMLDGLDKASSECDRAKAAAVGAGEYHAAWLSHVTTGKREDPDRLHGAILSLREWLRSPTPSVVAGSWPPWLVWTLLGLGVVLALPAALLGAWALALVGLLVGAGLGLWATQRRMRQAGAVEPDRRARWQEHARSYGVVLAKWDEAAVLDALQGREAALHDVEQARRVAVEIRRAEDRVALAGDRSRQAETTLDRVRGELRLAPALAGLALAQQARSLAAWVEAEAVVAGASERHRNLARQAVDGLAGLAQAHAPYLAGRIGALDSAARATAEISGLSESVAGLGTLRARREGKTAELGRLETEVRAGEAEHRKVLVEAGLADSPDELPTRLEVLPAWKAACVSRDDLDRRAARLQAELEAEGAAAQLDIDLHALDVAASEILVQKLERQGAQVEELSRQEGELNNELARARQGHTIEDAAVRLAETTAALQKERDRAIADALVRLVLDDAQRTQEATHAPPVLDRARTWFGRFTRHGWRLEVDQTGKFLAVDERTQARRSLEELSDATRIQLLLAARLAALEQYEATSGPLPLCLDEVLSTTDPVRFAEIGGALLELANAGRQILYLTADRSEVAYWQQVCTAHGAPPPHVIDLGDPQPRDLPEGVTLSLPQRSAVPEPGQDDADAYARRLGVHAPDGHRPVEAWHLAWLMPDQLPLLHACLVQGLDSVGPWRAVRLLGRGLPGVDEAAARRVDVRASLLGAVLDAWRTGRGRPVTWPEVLASGAISDTFVERVQALIGSHGHNPRAFLQAVSELARFRQSAVDALQKHLIDMGALDERPIATADEVVRRAVFDATGAIDAGILSVGEANDFAARCGGLLS